MHHLLVIAILEVLTNRRVSGETWDRLSPSVKQVVNDFIASGKRHVIFLMPPGSAKSTYTSVDFIPWYLSQHKDHTFLACSYSYTLAEGFGRRCRNLVDQYETLLGYKLAKDSKSSGEWETDKGGRYFCAGVGSGIAGHRADGGLIDDYIGSETDADSKLIRDSQWDWLQGDFLPRVTGTREPPDPWLAIIANRRNEDDLVGRIIEKEPENWFIVRIPYWAEEGDPLGRPVGERLWTGWFTEKHEAMVRRLAPRIQAGLYQQRPAPEEGDYFLKEWCLTYTREEYDQLMQNEANLSVYAAADWAVSEEKDGNRTCFGGAVMPPSGILYVLPDLFWKKAGPKETIRAFVDFLKRRKPQVTWSEKGHITKAWGPFLKEEMWGDDVFSYIKEVTPVHAKDVRARSIQGRMSMLRVRFPGFASWWPAALHELLTFPGGKTDDFIDFLAHLGLGLGSMTKAVLPQDQAPEMSSDWRPTFGWLKNQEKERTKLESRYAGR